MNASTQQFLIFVVFAVAAYLAYCWWQSYAGTVDGTGISRGFMSGDA